MSSGKSLRGNPFTIQIISAIECRHLNAASVPDPTGSVIFEGYSVNSILVYTIQSKQSMVY